MLSVSARVRDEKQRGADATDDEDLRIEIDGEKFSKLNNPQRYFDSPAAFSGGKLHNTSKTVYFITQFRAGKHAVSLIPDQGALVERVDIQNIADPSHVAFGLNQQAEDGNNKPWLTFVLRDLGLKSLTVKAQARWRFSDGDDIKVIVDDNIKKNKSSILHRNWIFASNVIRKILKSETGEANADKPEQSIKWGVRWLDHKAQGITDAGERHWRPWNEAVRNYNSQGNTKYEKEVYGVYKNGIDNRDKKNPIKLWTIIFFLLGCGVAGSVLFGIQRYNNQGKMWLTFEDGKEKRAAYVLTLNRIEGLVVRHIPISVEYTNGGNTFAIIKRATPQERVEDLFGSEPYAVVVTGEGWGGFLIKYVLKETDNGLALVPIVGEYGEGDDNDAFHADEISFVDTDGDGIMEVDEAGYVFYENALDQIWHSWYQYNASAGRYEFFRKDKEIATEWDI